ncbi:DUF1183-domain-containing protein [Acaromyces ingoldii]|uniref:Store-operated calcium entry-associated regulatory factor n=1 Tax=Acaromyces ingoldii TaxID=215250 RepID=A0A316YGZ3_9BASI|nr:DUF1183-domain-containing protein [Acaromyces ingoldii]PWN88469.1 DUF1183-domain-containing protein [Acaromyces ingoldii]
MLFRRRTTRLSLLLLTALWACLVFAPWAEAARGSSNSNNNRGRSGANPNVPRVRMDSLKTLFFKSGARTMARRTPPRPQLRCVGSSKRLCEMYEPDMVVCKSMGDGAWKCDAELAKSVRMGAIEVSCEGWDNADDEYVMRGSCGLEYNLLPAYVEGAYGAPLDGFSSLSNGRKKWYEDLFMLAFVAVVAYILLRLLKAIWRDMTGVNNAPRGPGGGGGGGGGGWPGGWFGGGGGGGWTPGWGPGGHDGPPPPYPGHKPSSSTQPDQQQQQGWRPGFWTGMGLGGLAAGAAQTLFNGQDRQGQRERYMRGDRFGSGSGSGSSSRWDSPSMTAGRRRFDYDDDNDNSFGGGGGGGGGFGGAGPSGTRTSTGFGGTRNR